MTIVLARKPEEMLSFRQITTIASTDPITLKEFFENPSIRMSPSFERLLYSPERSSNSILIARYHLRNAAKDSDLSSLFPKGRITGVAFLAALIERDKDRRERELGKRGLPNILYLDHCSVSAVWQIGHWFLDVHSLDERYWPQGTRIFVPPQ